MQLVLPEIFVEVRELSLPLLLGGLAVGVLLWTTGWWGHRFWVVLFATVAAGVFGLQQAPLLNMEPLLGALLFAVAAGMLGLALMRLAAFAAGGIACLLLIHNLVPAAHAPAVCFLAGGLLATLLFRLWIMLLTSFAGAVLVLYTVLGLVDQLIDRNLIEWVQQNSTALTWTCLGGTLTGFVLQFFWDRYRKNSTNKKKKKDKDSSDKESSSKSSNDNSVLAWIPFRRAA